MEAIRIKNLEVEFKLRHDKQRTLRKTFLSLISGKKESIEEFYALKDINLTVEKGQTLGIIGKNGAGKTTLLRIIAGIFSPDKGNIYTQGKISTLLGLGVGFQSELSGVDNIYLNGAILGLSRDEIDKKFEDILNFSELGKFIDIPVKNYSSGMYARLGFSIAINVNPDILLIDEILAVGDVAFQQKCHRRMEEFKKENRTILFVSHSIEKVRQFCSRAIWLENGKIILDGKPDEVTKAYLDRYGIAK